MQQILSTPYKHSQFSESMSTFRVLLEYAVAKSFFVNLNKDRLIGEITQYDLTPSRIYLMT